MNIHIYVSYHIPFLIIPDQCFIPIQVGRDLAKVKLDMIGDNTGNNISVYNPDFSELVTQYWAWKNDNNCDYIGFFHYRRYLNFFPTSKSNSKLGSLYGLDKDSIENTIKNYDIIVPPPLNCGNLYNATLRPFGTAWADSLIKQMKQTKPEFSASIDSFYSSSSAHLYNLYIMKRELFDEFCEFLFGTLLPLKETIGDKVPYKTLPRFFGYAAEQFINIYIDYLKKEKDIKVLYLDPLIVRKQGDDYSFHHGYY